MELGFWFDNRWVGGASPEILVYDISRWRKRFWSYKVFCIPILSYGGIIVCISRIMYIFHSD